MRMTKKTLAMAAATAIALSACSSTDGGDGGDNGEGGGDASSLALADINEVDRGELTQGGNLRLAVTTLPSNYNPMQIDGNTVDNSDIAGFVLPINWIFAEDATFEPNPTYLEGYDVNDAPEDVTVTTPDGDEVEVPQVVTLTLNPEAKWNDGDPITAEDYIATWSACRVSGEFQCASTDGWNRIASIEQGADEFEVVVNYNIVYPDWSATLSTVQRKESVETPEVFNEGWTNPMDTPEFYTGPFKFENVDTAQKRITLTPNENWWGEAPMLDSVIFSELTAEASAQAFANNELDVVAMIIDAPTYELVQNRPDHDLRMSASPQWRHYTFNTRAESVSDKEFRQAIQMGIDSADITASALSGLPTAEMDMKLGNHFFMPGQEGYQDNSVEYDPEGAMAKLEELGYEKAEGDEYYSKDGKNAGFQYLRMPDVPTSVNEGNLLQSQMKDIGIEVTFRDVPSAEFFDYVIGGEYEVAAFAWNGTPYPMANVGQIYGKPFDESGKLVNSNFSGLEDPEIDEYVERIAAETDHEERIKLTNEVDQIIWDNVMTVPTYYRANITATPANLANYGASAFKTQLPENIGYTE